MRSSIAPDKGLRCHFSGKAQVSNLREYEALDERAQGRVVKSEFPTIDAAEDQGTNVRQADKREALF